MANNGPISVSQSGTSLTNATGNQVTFNTRYPFHKLDSTKATSFTILNILFGVEPPNPAAPTVGATTSNTLVYTLPHGYTYVPSTWFLISVDNFATTKGPEGAIIFSSPTSGLPNSTNAKLNIQVDATNIYFYVAKTWGYVFGTPDPNPPNIVGLLASIRIYVFVEDLLGGSVLANP